jgi:hypothetical protein
VDFKLLWFHLRITGLGKFVIFFDITGSERNRNLPIISMYPQFIGFSQSTISGISVLPKKRQLGIVIQAIEPV